ncbi:MAG TPA: lysylphosphatidylglycerol synthase domain-containing protein [Candidatus Acidoferrales bacterium]|nr:lysylphosphatidylglycerol synthase domain-containing protein [Candidatus Acidoferrales bacterium]
MTAGETSAKRRPGRLARQALPALLTALIFYLIFQRVSFSRFVGALGEADYRLFLVLMVPNALAYFAWDTLVLAVVMRWFHGPIRYRDLLPVRAVAYVLTLVNSDLAEGATAVYLTRQSGAAFWEIAGTVVFLSWLELTHLSIWAAAGMLARPVGLPRELWLVPAGFAAFWTFFLLYARRDFAPWRPLVTAIRRATGVGGIRPVRDWPVFRTFRQAAPGQYGLVILLKSPMFFFSLLIHYWAARAFGFHIPLLTLLAFLPIVFMLSALPVTVAHLGTTQAAWIFFFHPYAPAPKLLAFSLAAHLAFVLARAGFGLAFVPRAYGELTGLLEPRRTGRAAGIASVTTGGQ